jgi:hypothetical protein
VASESNATALPDDLLARNGYLWLTSLIQAIVFGVFVASLNKLQWRALDRWPFVITEFLNVVLVCFGHVAISRDLCWQLDLLDVFIPFMLGLLQCLPMLLLGMIRNDALWWFVCYFALTNFIFLALLNSRMKTPATIALPLTKTRAILCTVHLYLLLLAMLACYYHWQIQLVGILFMVEQIGVFFTIYFFDRRTRAGPRPGPAC